MRVLLAKGAVAIGLSWLIATLGFWAIYSLPGDLALQVAGHRFVGTPPDTDLAAGLRADYGLDRPLLAQYGDWISQVLWLEFGRSLVTGRPVTEELAPHLRNSFMLGSLGLAGAVLIAFPLGYLSGRRPNTTLDRIASIYCSVLTALPAFLLSVLFIRLFIVEWKLGSLSGDTSLARIALPVTIVMLGVLAPVLWVVRNAVVDVTGALYFTFARMRGVPARQLFWRHGIRNAALPVLAYMSTLFVYLVYDLVVIEVVFNYPGIGHALHRAIEARDVPVIQYATLVLVLAYLILVAVTDLLSQLLDPRIELGRQR